MEISTDLYTKLWKSKTIAHTQLDLPAEQKTVKLPLDQTLLIRNGVTLGHYLIVLKNAMRRNNQDLNIDEQVIDSLVNSKEQEHKIANFKKIQAELDKVGISLEEEDVQMMAKGDKDKLISPFMRIERFLTKIAGKKIFDFEDVQESARSPISPIKKQATINKPVERQKSILKNQLSIKVPPPVITNSGNSPLQSPIKKLTQKSIIPPGSIGGSVVIEQFTDAPQKQATQLKSGKQSDKTVKRGLRPNQKKGGKQAVVDIMSMDVNRKVDQTESSLELILNTLCRACEMKPKQAAALLTNNNQYLIHSVIKGFKGEFSHLQSWFSELYINSSHLCILVEQETEDFPDSGNCQKVLQSIAVGMYSARDNLDICLQSMKVLNRLCDEFSVSQSVIDNAYKWFIGKEGGFELCLHSLSNHSIQDLGEDIANLISQFINTAVNQEERFIQIYKERFLKYYTSPALYLQAINEMFPYIIMKNKEEMLRSDILAFWIDIALRQADNQQNLSVEERIPSLTFLAEVWYQFTPIIDQKGNDLSNSFLAALRKCSRDKSIASKIVAISLMFRLLDKFAVEKNISAPLIYKSLIFTMVESCHDQTLREHYLANFTYLFQKVPSIPISLLIDPMLKQMQSTTKKFDFNIFDFDFFKNLSQHPKFNLSMALAVSDLLSKLIQSDPVASTFVINIIVDIFDRHLNNEQSMEQPMHNFVLNLVQQILNQLPELEKQGGRKGAQSQLLPPKSPSKRHVIGGGKAMKEENDREGPRLIKKAMSIGLIQRILQLRGEELNEQIRLMLVQSGQDFKSKNGQFHKGILSLLAFFSNNPLEMITPVIKEPKVIQNKAQISSKLDKDKSKIKAAPSNKNLLAIMPSQTAETGQNSQTTLDVYKGPTTQPSSTLSMSRKPRSISNYNTNSLDSKRKQLSHPLQSNDGTLALPSTIDNIPQQQLPDLQFYQNRHQQQMDNLIKKKFDSEEQKRQEEEKKRATSARKKARMRDMLEKRKAELGVSSMRKPLVEGVGISLKPSGDSTKQLIHDDGVVEQELETNKWEKSYKIQITLLDLNFEEQRDQEAIKTIMKRYQKLWRYLFTKYANTITSQSKGGNFDKIGENTQIIHYAEVTKMLKDHGLLPVFIQKEELYQFFRLLNLKMNNKSETKVLDYQGYCQLIPQIAFLSFSRPPKDLSFMPLVQSLLTLIQIFRETARQKNWAIFLYEDPELGVQPGVDNQLIKALNEKLKKDPTYPIPEGFVKVSEKTPVYDYRIPIEIAERLEPSKVVSIEILDEIVNNAFGFHFLEPLVTFEEFPKVKPVMNQVKPMQAEAVSIMNKAEGSKKISLQPDPTSRSVSQLQQPTDEDDFFRPKLNLPLKLEVSKYPLTDRPHIQQVAEVMEELLSYLQDKNFTIDSSTANLHLPPRPRKVPGHTQNEAKRMKEEDQRHKSELRSREMEKWKKRKEELKTEIDRLKAQKENEEKEKQVKDVELKKVEDKKKKVLDEDAKKRYDDNKKKIEEAKKHKQLESEDKKKADEWKAKEDKEKRQKEAKEFFKAQKDRLINEFGQVTKDRELVQEKKNEIKRKEEEQFSRLKNAMEGYIKDNGKQVKEVIKKENEEIVTFIERQDIQDIFSKYDVPLRHLYKFYAAQDKLDWLDHNQENMNLKEFIRFSFQHRIIPVLIEKPDDLVKLFKHAVKAEGGYANNHLTFDAFKKGLVRISVLAQDQIGGQHEDKLSDRIQFIINEQDEARTKRDKALKQVSDKQVEQTAKHEELKQEFKAKVADKVIKKMEVHQGKKIYQDVPSEKIYEINENLKQQEEEFFKKWLKVRESKGIGKKKHGSTMNTSELVSPHMRKTKEQRILKDLANQEQKVDGLNNIDNKLDEAKTVKVLDSVKGNFDVQIITPKTIENFLKFLGLVPDLHKYHLDKNLDKFRIDIQGQRPNKFLKESTKNELRQVSRGGDDSTLSNNNARKLSVKKSTGGDQNKLQPIKQAQSVQKANTPEKKKPGDVVQKSLEVKPKLNQANEGKREQKVQNAKLEPQLAHAQEKASPLPAAQADHKPELPQHDKKDEVKPAQKKQPEPHAGDKIPEAPIKQEVWNNGKPVIDEIAQEPSPSPQQSKDHIKPDPIVLDKKQSHLNTEDPSKDLNGAALHDKNEQDKIPHSQADEKQGARQETPTETKKDEEQHQ